MYAAVATRVTERSESPRDALLSAENPYGVYRCLLPIPLRPIVDQLGIMRAYCLRAYSRRQTYLYDDMAHFAWTAMNMLFWIWETNTHSKIGASAMVKMRRPAFTTLVRSRRVASPTTDIVDFLIVPARNAMVLACTEWTAATDYMRQRIDAAITQPSLLATETKETHDTNKLVDRSAALSRYGDLFFHLIRYLGETRHMSWHTAADFWMRLCYACAEATDLIAAVAGVLCQNPQANQQAVADACECMSLLVAEMRAINRDYMDKAAQSMEIYHTNHAAALDEFAQLTKGLQAMSVNNLAMAVKALETHRGAAVLQQKLKAQLCYMATDGSAADGDAAGPPAVRRLSGRGSRSATAQSRRQQPACAFIKADAAISYTGAKRQPGEDATERAHAADADDELP